ncbi:MAG: hypothetical protein H6710_08005 [Myxococcales bacterium]|nr:hypothetical protein [Myxococcales bacterium]
MLIGAGIPVPPGVCVTVDAFEAACAGAPRLARALAALDEAADAGDLERDRAAAEAVRAELGALPFPPSLEDRLIAAWRALGEEHAYARSARRRPPRTSPTPPSPASRTPSSGSAAPRPSATRSGAAGRRSTAIGRSPTGGAWGRRGRAGDGGGDPADDRRRRGRRGLQRRPQSGHRGIAAIEAIYGLGEALVSGRALADVIRVRKADGAIVSTAIADKARAIRCDGAGGTREVEVEASRRQAPVLTGDEARALAALAAEVEALRGAPQDLEWAREGGALFLLQARPITTLFPAPRFTDGRRHVLASLGHIQVNTAPWSRLGRGILAHFIPFRRPPGRGSSLIHAVGGRIYVDVTPALARAPLSVVVPRVLAVMHAPMAERLRAVARRDDVLAAARASQPSLLAVARVLVPTLARTLGRLLGRPRRVRDRYLRGLDEGLAGAQARIRGAATPAARLQAAVDEVDGAFRWLMFRGALPLLPLLVVSGAVVAALTRRFAPGVAEDALLRGLDGNITTSMNLALGDVVDLARPHPELRAAIVGDVDLLALRGRPAFAEFFAALDRFLATYGSRCAGEIDVGVPRWRDDPRALGPMMAGLLGGPPGSHRTRHQAMQQEAEAARAAMVAGARRRPLVGWLLGPVLSAITDWARVLASVREHHKATMIEILAEVRAAALAVGEALEAAGSLARADDVFLLDLDEALAAAQAAHAGSPPRDLAARCDARRREEARFAALTPPPLMTDEGELPPLPSGAAAPPGTLIGTPASSGAAIGRARVIRDPGREVLAAGEILVAPFTDPGWTPLFMHAGGLVMEVGGVMTHGSVIARELGIPAVVAVDGALARIRDGQRIRVDGDRGWVELLADEDEDGHGDEEASR